jgi:hypothetical protein
MFSHLDVGYLSGLEEVAQMPCVVEELSPAKTTI